DEGPPGPLFGGAPAPIETDPAIVTELIGARQASIAASERDIRTKSGSALLDFIQADIQELKRILFDPQSHQVFMSAMEAAWWLNDQLQAWLGEKNGADPPPQSVPPNATWARGGGFPAPRAGGGFRGGGGRALGGGGSGRRHRGLARKVRHALRW